MHRRRLESWSLLLRVWWIVHVAVALLTQSAAAAQEPSVRESCSAAGRTALGDPTTLSLVPGERLERLDAIVEASLLPGRWVERERIEAHPYALVVVEWPGDEAALVVLERRNQGYCVETIWGFSFGGLGVALTVADRAMGPFRGDAALVVLEATATHNDPAGSTADPSEERRLVIAVGPSGAAVVADTREAAWARFSERHWFVETAGGERYLRMSRGSRTASRRWDSGESRLLR